MSYSVYKLLGFLVQPSTLIWLVVVAGLVILWRTRQQRLGLRLAGGGTAALLMAGLSPLSTWVMAPLEQRFPRLDAATLADQYAGIIVLGGGEDGRSSVERRQLHINTAGDRITESLVLARRLPSARLIFTGGSAAILNDIPSAAHVVGAYWQAVGIPASRIVLEGGSRTTYENAIETRAMLKPRPGERFLLVTSAWHMPRAMGVFRQAGFDVVAYPCDFRTSLPADALDVFSSMPDGLKRLDEAVKEWIGLVAYRLMGRSGSLWPGP